VLRAYPTHVKGKPIELQKDTEDEARIFQERAQALHALITSLEELKQAHALAEKKWSEEKAQLNQNIEQLNQNIEQLAVALNHSQATLAWTEDQLKNHQNSLHEVLNSASWKLTKPLRALKP
jgi:chromosome segregation ATPase